MFFLKRVEAVIRDSYYPLYEADKRSTEWAQSRYPKRFYNDCTEEGMADAYISLPPQWLIYRLFKPMQVRVVDRLWGIHRGLHQK